MLKPKFNFNQAINVKYKIFEELSELDFDLHEEFYPGYEDRPEIVSQYPQDGHRWYADGEAIKLDKLIKFLKYLKEMGCTHVKMDAHVDHHGYVFNGLEISKATKKDIEQYLEIVKQQYVSRIQDIEEESAKQKEHWQSFVDEIIEHQKNLNDNKKT